MCTVKHHNCYEAESTICVSGLLLAEGGYVNEAGNEKYVKRFMWRTTICWKHNPTADSLTAEANKAVYKPGVGRKAECGLLRIRLRMPHIRMYERSRDS